MQIVIKSNNLHGSTVKPNYLDWEELGIGKNLVYLVVFGLTCWILLLIIDSGLFSSTFARFKKKIEHIGFKSKSQNGSEESKSFGNEDEDVKNERRRIENTNMEQLSVTDNLIIRYEISYKYSLLCHNCLSVNINSVLLKINFYKITATSQKYFPTEPLPWTASASE